MDLAQRIFFDSFRELQRAMAAFEQPSSFFNVGAGNSVLSHDSSLFGVPRGSLMSSPRGGNLLRYPSTNIDETPDSYEVSAELPGYDKKDIKIDLTDSRTLVLSGSVNQQCEASSVPITEEGGEDFKKAAEKHKAAAGSKEGQQQQVVKKDDESRVTQHLPSDSQWWVNERVSGSFTRTLSFPTHIDGSKIKASYRDGVLKIFVPKAKDSSSRQIGID